MRSEQQLPADFPIPVPDEYEVQAVGEAGNETAVILRVPSGEDAYNYYRQALADSGFRVVDEGRNRGLFFDAELEFSDNNLEGNIDFDGDTAEIDLERYEAPAIGEYGHPGVRGSRGPPDGRLAAGKTGRLHGGEIVATEVRCDESTRKRAMMRPGEEGYYRTDRLTGEDRRSELMKGLGRAVLVFICCVAFAVGLVSGVVLSVAVSGWGLA